MSEKENGDFFAAHMLEKCVMNDATEKRAEQGICPRCQAPRLCNINENSAIIFRQCSHCGTIVALGK